MPFGHSKRGIKQRSSFDRLYDCAVRITSSHPRGRAPAGSRWPESPTSAISTLPAMPLTSWSQEPGTQGGT
jgi:hypothetical protein